MVHVPMCEWCGEHEVGSINGGSSRFCSMDCTDSFNDSLDIFEDTPCDWCGKASITLADGNVRYCSEKCREESDTNRANFVPDGNWGDLPDYWDDGRWDDDPSPYGGTYSED
jgi:hypothetical protein